MEYKKIVAVTACPIGIAHSYMAAKALEQKAKELGISLKVEIDGALGIKNELTDEDIQSSDAVIIAADKQVGMDRFIGKTVIQVSCAEAIQHAEELLKRAQNQEPVIVKKVLGHKSFLKAFARKKKGTTFVLFKHLMNGFSEVIPFFIGGGILFAISFLLQFGGSSQSNGFLYTVANTVGRNAFNLILPVMSGYISLSIAGRSGLPAGMVGGMLATQSGGYVGAVLSGVISGYIIIALKRILHWIPQPMEWMKSMVLYPLLGILLTGILMLGIY